MDVYNLKIKRIEIFRFKGIKFFVDRRKDINESAWIAKDRFLPNFTKNDQLLKILEERCKFR